MTLALTLEEARCIGLCGLDSDVNSNQIRANASIFYFGIVSVVRRVNQ
jgi:hypothetical protein